MMCREGSAFGFVVLSRLFARGGIARTKRDCRIEMAFWGYEL